MVLNFHKYFGLETVQDEEIVVLLFLAFKFILFVTETKPGIFKVDYVEKRPIERPVIISWEQRNTTLLPEDLKNFFMTSNGFHLEWSVKMESMYTSI